MSPTLTIGHGGVALAYLLVADLPRDVVLDRKIILGV
jgi:hypothetical protein